jgi:ornithine cyclodeaminase
MILLSASEVRALLPMATCVDLMIDAMVQVSERRAALPLRQFMPIAETTGKLGLMPGAIAEPHRFGLKIVNKYARAADDPLGTHVGMVVLCDAPSGVVLAILEGGTLTAIRTAAASGLATRLLAREDATHLAMIGAGEEAHVHIEAMLAVRPIDTITVWNRTRAKAETLIAHLDLPRGVSVTLADSPESAVSRADIICTVTSSPTPVLRGAVLPKGAHVNLVGAAVATSAEVDSAFVKAGKFYVDYREAAMAAAGELLNAIKDGTVTAEHIVGEIGEVLLRKKPGRENRDEITIYKSLGVSAQDLVAAEFLYQQAKAKGRGLSFALNA